MDPEVEALIQKGRLFELALLGVAVVGVAWWRWLQRRTMRRLMLRIGEHEPSASVSSSPQRARRRSILADIRHSLPEYFHPLGKTVRRVAKEIRRCVRQHTAESPWVAHYGAFNIHPRYLVYWVCVKTDSERNRLAADTVLNRKLRDLLVTHNYPSDGRADVRIGFESQETVDRESDGNWWIHWK